MVASCQTNLHAYYSSTVRLSMLDKLGISNTYAVPTLDSAVLSIELKNLSDFDDSRLIAAVFILRLLSGGRPYISRFGLFQTFHTKTYDSVVEVKIAGYATFRLFTLLSERVFPYLAKADYGVTVLKNQKGILVNMTIADLSFIRVVETHSVFFRWHDKVRINAQLRGCGESAATLLLGALKSN